MDAENKYTHEVVEVLIKYDLAIFIILSNVVDMVNL